MNPSVNISPDRIPIHDFFSRIGKSPYTLIRGAEIPLKTYQPKTRMTVFCYFPDAFSREVLAFFNSLNLGKEWTSHVIEVDEALIQIEFRHHEEPHISFELFGAFPRYSKTNIRSSFFESVIDNSVDYITQPDEGSSIRVPCAVDDAILRYVEYIEYYEIAPDRLKHLDYLEEKIGSSPEQRHRFLDRLHHYTDLPKCTLDANKDSALNSRPAETLSTGEIIRILLKRLIQRK